MCYSTASVLKRAFEISFSRNHHRQPHRDSLSFHLLSRVDLDSLSALINSHFSLESHFQFQLNWISWNDLVDISLVCYRDGMHWCDRTAEWAKRLVIKMEFLLPLIARHNFELHSGFVYALLKLHSCELIRLCMRLHRKLRSWSRSEMSEKKLARGRRKANSKQFSFVRAEWNWKRF